MGYDSAKASQAAGRVMELETAIAKASVNGKIHVTRSRIITKISFKQLTESTPNLDWAAFIEAAGLRNVDTVVVGQPEFLTAINDYLKTFSLDDWKNYLRFHLVRGLARYMDDKTYLESFSFYSTTLRGIKEPKPRWKRVVEQTMPRSVN